MGSGNEPDGMMVAYMMGKLDASDDVKELRDRIAELEAELKKEKHEHWLQFDCLKKRIVELETELKETKEESESHEAWADTFDSLRIRAENEQRRLEAELAVVNLALRNAKNDDWAGMGFELDDEVIDRFSKNAIERARKQLIAEKEQS